LNPREKFKYLAKIGPSLLQCIACGDCREATDFSAIPQKWGVCVARDHTSGFEPFFGRGKMQIIRSLWQGKLELSKEMAEALFQCPTCNACAEACAYDIDNTAIYEALRAELVDAGCGLEAHIPMHKAMVELYNPYVRDNKLKKQWIEKLGFNVKDAKTQMADILFFVGCTSALTPDIETVAIHTAQIFHKLGIDFSVFGEHEICCGSVAMRTGNREVFNFVASKNYDLFKKSGVKTIVTSCAGCYRTLKIDYADYLKYLGIEVLHTIEFLYKVIKEKDVPLKDLKITATYHDPCHAGRHIGLYDEPRELLKKVASLTEMKTIKQNAKCCGAGGGVKKGFPELAIEIAKSRVQEAEETGADYLVSICPFCYRNLSDAIIAINSKLRMKDLTELLNQALN
jgi:heterodisulfide reductase subunit D